MFEKASKLRLRYKVSNGVIATEDLWELSLKSLDTLAKSVYKEIQETGDISFINESVGNSLDELRLEIIKHVIQVKLAQRDEAALNAEKQARKQTIMQILADKKDNSLREMSEEELIKALESLK